MALKLRRLVWVGIGLALVFLPALPVVRWGGGRDTGPVWAPNVESWLLGLVIVSVVGLVASRLTSRLSWRFPFPSRKTLPWILGGLGLAVSLASVFAMRGVFAGNPHLVDETAQLLHAKAFAGGQLALPAPNPQEFFVVTNTMIVDAGWVSQYPPGHIWLLAVGFLVGLEWLVNPVLAGLGAIFIFVLGRGLYGPKTGLYTAVLWLLAPWVMFTFGTYMNHGSATVLIVASLAMLVWNKTPGVVLSALAGFFLAFASAIRPLDAIAVFPAVALLAFKRSGFKGWWWMALGGLPVILAIGYHNWELFGSPTTFGYSILYGREHGLGFHVNPWGESFTPRVALGNLAAAIRRIHIYMFELPVPPLLVMSVWAIWQGGKRTGDGVVALGMLGTPILYFFYWHSGFYPGPRFYFAIVPFLILGLARTLRSISGVLNRWTNPSFNFKMGWNFALLFTVIWGTVDILPRRVEVYREGLSSMKLHPERALAELGVTQALVLVPESFGSRIIVGLWGLGVPAGLAERAYRNVDACDLYQTILEARASHLPPEHVVGRIELLMADNRPDVFPIEGWPYETLRLRVRDDIPEECTLQLQRDIDGFTAFGNLAWKNSVDRRSGIVFARDLFERNGELLSQYPGWEVWRWAPTSSDPLGPPRLSRLQMGSPPAP